MAMSTKDKELIEDIKTFLSHLKTERQKRESDWEDVQKYVAKSILSFSDTGGKIPKRPKRFTGKPTQYLKTMVAGLSGYSISPNIIWMKLSLEDITQLELYGVKDWLEACERVMYTEFSRSNLYPQTTKMLEYGGTYGHGATLINEDVLSGRLRFTTHPIQELYFDFNENDTIDTVYRCFTMTLKNAASFFGKDALSDNSQKDLDDKRNWNNEIRIIHAVYPRQLFDEDLPDARNMPYVSLYIDESNDHVLLESGFREFPYAVFIWDKVVGTAYGESPAIWALDDIRMLNKTDESRLRIAQYSANPMLNVPESMIGNESVVPGGYNYYAKPNEVMIPINTGENYPISIEVTQEYEERVKDWFNVDFFLMLQQRQRQMTATEVIELQGEKASVLSDLIVSLNGALTTLIQRSFNILYRQGKIPPPPDILRGSGAQLKIDFVGPLAQAQKKYHESGSLQQGLGFIGAIAQLPPAQAALDVVDFDALMKTGLESAGIPQSAIREQDDIDAIRQARAQQQAAMQQQALQLEQQKQVLGNLNKLNEPVNQGSPLSALTSQLAGTT